MWMESELSERFGIPQWKVQVFGERCSKQWEICVIRVDNAHGQKSWGCIDDCKLLVGHSGGPCHWPVCGFVWDHQIATAEELCQRLNDGESVET